MNTKEIDIMYRRFLKLTPQERDELTRQCSKHMSLVRDEKQGWDGTPTFRIYHGYQYKLFTPAGRVDGDWRVNLIEQSDLRHSTIFHFCRPIGSKGKRLMKFTARTYLEKWWVARDWEPVSAAGDSAVKKWDDEMWIDV